MIKNFKITKVIYTIIIVLITSATFADDLPPAFDNNDVEDNAPAAPINEYIVETFVVGMFIAFYGIRKNRQVKTVLNTNKDDK